MKRLAVINVVGLTRRLIGEHTPFLKEFSARRDLAVIRPVLPAVTCSVQATYLTGKPPAQHGIVGNGWYFTDECEVKFWRQSNRLVQADKIWDRARRVDPNFTCANLFWWYNMYSSADISVTPRPQYPADGRKIPDIYTQPPDWRDELQNKLGTFPLFDFWGPKTSIRSSRWIAEAAKMTEVRYAPTLTLIYLPHLDYNLQRHGNDFSRIAGDLRAIDGVCRDLAAFHAEKGVEVVFLSEYGITDVSRPVHINRELRERGLIAVREESGRELLDAGASAAFAVADHQIAHVYVNRRERAGEVEGILKGIPGVESVLDDAGKRRFGLDHERAGDFVCVADARSWFTYYYWTDDAKAPDFARTVDIHRKPGYDPAELFVDPAIRLPALKVAGKLMRKALGFRYLMDVIPLDANGVKGSHGRIPESKDDWPVLIGAGSTAEMAATEVFDRLTARLSGR